MWIEEKLENIERPLNELLEWEESYALMKLSEESLKEFLENEPDIYSEDLIFSSANLGNGPKRDKPKDMLTFGV